MKQRIMISLAPFFLSSCLTAYASSQLKQEPVLHHNDLLINYVEPSSQIILKTKEKIKDLFNLQYDNEYTIQKIGTQTYWIGVQYYNATVIINDEGVLVIDPLRHFLMPLPQSQINLLVLSYTLTII
ncbi:hypothetical protein [Zooshikella harenae]|uniref:Uncharacterized protein n=1 Tax=Zooshikella harenae TaxID=2827238 RepID=A0ABS5ZB29_9GAMM|nr:hypothetical protein [Zooshikella harenae]MBU2710506.1 hypothetical protein [Zooshikella harenae]